MLSRFPLRESADDPRRGLIGAVMLAGGIHGRDNLASAYGADKKKLRFVVMVRNPTLRAFSWCKRRKSSCRPVVNRLQLHAASTSPPAGLAPRALLQDSQT